jgi:UrcA family protein
MTMNIFNKTITLATAAAITSLSFSAATRATELDGTPQISVDYHDLDISSETGRQVLDTRIKRAASLICRDLTGDMLSERAARQECMRQTIARANTAITAKLAALPNGQATAELTATDPQSAPKTR